jgi:iron only hydrogenase large subunit-like protein
LQPIDINDASYYGRIFAYTNGIIEGINEKSQNKFETIGMDGIEECGKILSNEFKDHDFFGGMACLGGCINGPCVLKQSLSNKKDVVAYAKAAKNGK